MSLVFFGYKSLSLSATHYNCLFVSLLLSVSFVVYSSTYSSPYAHLCLFSFSSFKSFLLYVYLIVGLFHSISFPLYPFWFLLISLFLSVYILCLCVSLKGLSLFLSCFFFLHSLSLFVLLIHEYLVLHRYISIAGATTLSMTTFSIVTFSETIKYTIHNILQIITQNQLPLWRVSFTLKVVFLLLCWVSLCWAYWLRSDPYPSHSESLLNQEYFLEKFYYQVVIGTMTFSSIKLYRKTFKKVVFRINKIYRMTFRRKRWVEFASEF
jgi:hypothetical protein